MYSIIGSKTDLHVLGLELRNSRHDVIPRARNVDSEIGENVHTYKHHREALGLGKSVVMDLAVSVVHSENYHSRLVKRSILCKFSGLSVELDEIIEITESVNRKNSGTDRVVDNASLVKSVIYVGTLLCKN